MLFLALSSRRLQRGPSEFLNNTLYTKTLILQTKRKVGPVHLVDKRKEEIGKSKYITKILGCLR